MERHHWLSYIYLISIIPLSYLGLKHGWVTGNPDLILSAAVRDVGVLSLIALIGLSTSIEILRSNRNGRRAWAYFVVGFPVIVALTAFITVLFSTEAPQRLAVLGTTLFWFAVAVYVITIGQFGIRYIR